MQLFRSLIFLLSQTLSAIVMSMVALPSLLLPSIPRAKVIGLWARYNIWALKWICGIRYRVQGKEHLPDEPSVIIANHQSAWETLCFQLIFPPQSYILKKQLLWIPFFGWGLAANRPVSINRSKKRKALDLLINKGNERIKEGRWLVVYPEGTRMMPGELAPFQVGGAMMATKSGAPIVPVAHNAGICWPKNQLRKYPGVIDVIIGEPIETKGRKPRDVNRESEEAVKELIDQLPDIH